MRRVFFIISFLFLAFQGFSQQIPLYSQYYQIPFLYNPARTGEKEQLHLHLLYRKQWVDFKGAPETRALTLDGTIKEKIGLGAYIYNDYTDIIERLGGQLAYAYHFNFDEEKNHKLSLGIAVGVQETSVDYNRATLDDPDEPLLTGNTQKGVAFDGAAGISYWIKGFHVGFSVPQLVETKIKRINNNEETGYQLARHYLATASYDIPVVKDAFYIEPMAMFRMAKGNTYQIDGGAAFKYKEIAWVSAMYRYDYAVTVSGGIQVHDRVALGYAYDLAINKLKDYSGGTHELFVGIKFGKKEDKGLIEAIKNLEDTQQRQATEIDSLSDESAKLKQENEDLKESIENETLQYDVLKEEMDQMVKEFRDSLTQAKKEILSLKKEKEEEKSDIQEDEFVTEQPMYMYYVVVGSFRSKNNAMRTADLLSVREYDPGIVYNKVLKMYYVYITRHKDYDSAKESVNHIRDATQYKDAWIYIQK